MLERLPDFESEYEELLIRISDPSAANDQRSFAELSRRFKTLEAIVMTGRALKAAYDDYEVAKHMVADASDQSDREVAKSEADNAQRDIERLEGEFGELLVPQDPNDGRNVIVSIRGAEGGEEANIFARDLLDMYLRWAESRKWKVEKLGETESERGGIVEATLLVSGNDAWRRLKHEGGPHRVQRVPVTESQGRVHTSSSVVTVLPEAQEVEVEIDPSDLKIDVYHSSGPGGQSVNTTDSAVRITHLPSGIVVAMQDERSQLQNRAKAMQVLRSRLLAQEQEKLSQEMSLTRKAQVGSGGRSEKIRTYNYKDNRVTDHRIGLTLYKLDKILLGDLDELSDALLADERATQLTDPEDKGQK